VRVVDVARKLGISADWLRRLERAGRIPSAPRDFHGHRRYAQEDLERIRAILFPTGDGDNGRTRAGRRVEAGR